MKKIHVGLYTPGWPQAHRPNGIVTYVNTIVPELSEDMDVSIITSKVGSTEKTTNVIKVENTAGILEKLSKKFSSYIPGRLGSALKYTTNISGKANAISHAVMRSSHAIDLIEIEESFGIGHFFQKDNKTPLLTRLHGPHFIHSSIYRESLDVYDELRIEYEGKGIIASKAVSSPSKDVLDKVRERYNIELPDAAVIPNPVFPVMPQKQWFSASTDIPSILFVGRFDNHKGGDLVLDAFNIIASHDRDVRLDFVGHDVGVYKENQFFKFNEYLNYKISNNEIRSRIVYHGQQSYDAVADLRRNSTVTVFPSRYENFSMSLLEAVATGCPVVCFNVGGNPEIIKNNFNGILVDTVSPESLAAEVLKLLYDNDKMIKISKSAVEDSIARFHPAVIAKKTYEFYLSSF